MYTLTDTYRNMNNFLKLTPPLKTASIPSRDAGGIPGPGTPPKLYSVVVLSDNNSLALSQGETGVEMKIPAATGPRAGLERRPFPGLLGLLRGSLVIQRFRNLKGRFQPIICNSGPKEWKGHGECLGSPSVRAAPGASLAAVILHSCWVWQSSLERKTFEPWI